MSIGRLAQISISKQPTVTRLLDRMEAKGQVERLMKIGEIMKTKLTGKKCKAMEGLVEEGKEVLEEKGKSALIDAALIGQVVGAEEAGRALIGVLHRHGRFGAESCRGVG